MTEPAEPTEPTEPTKPAGKRRRHLVLAALLPALATVLVYARELFRDTDEQVNDPAWLTITWLVLLVAAAPAVAAVFNQRFPVATTAARAMLIGLPQVVVALLLVRLDVWLEVRSGYLLAGSGEEAMAYGIGSIAGTIGGIILAGVVAGAAFAGARGAVRRTRGSVHHEEGDRTPAG